MPKTRRVRRKIKMTKQAYRRAGDITTAAGYIARYASPSGKLRITAWGGTRRCAYMRVYQALRNARDHHHA